MPNKKVTTDGDQVSHHDGLTILQREHCTLWEKKLGL